ncbi:MAG: GNAT family N-acetyltransferase [Candidatus Limnocylindria bacterium]
MFGGIVRGSGTALRFPTHDDIAAIARWSADGRVRRGGPRALWHEPASLATWKERFTEQAKDKASLLWSIETREGAERPPRLVGAARCAFWPPPLGDSVSLSYFVIEPDDWGKGYGFDAALALHRYVFDYLHLRFAEVELPADNDRALRLAQRLGYARYAHGHSVFYRDGGYADQYLMRLDLAVWDERFGEREREYAPLGAEAER